MFPFQALEAAAKLEEYTLVDWGTWNGVDQFVRDTMIIFVSIASTPLQYEQETVEASGFCEERVRDLRARG